MLILQNKIHEILSVLEKRVGLIEISTDTVKDLLLICQDCYNQGLEDCKDEITKLRRSGENE